MLLVTMLSFLVLIAIEVPQVSVAHSKASFSQYGKRTQLESEGITHGVQRFCGRRLVRVLQLVCKHRYHSSSNRDDGLVLSRSYQHGTNSKGQDQQQHGIVNRCCIQPCSYTVLMEYCQENNENTRSTNQSPTSPAPPSQTEPSLSHHNYVFAGKTAAGNQTSTTSVDDVIQKPKKRQQQQARILMVSNDPSPSNPYGTAKGSNSENTQARIVHLFPSMIDLVRHISKIIQKKADEMEAAVKSV